MSSPDHSESVAAIHQSVIFEAHRDCYELLYRLGQGADNPLRDDIVPRLRKGDVDVVLYAVGGDSIAHSGGRDKKLLATIETISAFAKAANDPTTGARVIRSASELSDTPDGKVGFIFHLEGGSPLEGSLPALEALFELGVRSIQPTWNVRNELGDGVKERATGSGLTQFGIAAVQAMEGLGIAIDLAHISEAGFWSVVENTTKPLIVSHSNAKAVHDHPRNVSDDQIKAIAERGGVIGVNTIPYFVDDNSFTIDRLIDHVEHMVELVGVEHVGMGGDYVKSDGPRSGREAHLHDPTKQVPEIEGLGESDELGNFTAALIRRGVNDDDIKAILGGNFVRVFRELLPA